MATQQLITIPKQELPSQSFAVTLVRPTFQDYSRAWKLYPGETRENQDGPGYSFEDFFCALSIRTPDGSEPDKRPKDAINRFDEIELKDKQFIVNTFISGFFITQDLQDEAEAFADDLLASDPTSLSYTLRNSDLPLQSLSITFNRPSSAVQLHVNKSFTSPSVNGCLFADLLLLTCVSHINGEEVGSPKNVLSIAYDYDLIDIQYASAVFINMFAMDLKERQKSTDLGKTLRDKLLRPSPPTSAKSLTSEKATLEATAKASWRQRRNPTVQVI